MAESQSRYGIMEELNNRKIKEKEKLANIERETDKKVYDTEKEINTHKQEVVEKKKTYKQDHKDKIRILDLDLKLLNSEYNRQKEKLDDSIKEENDTYEENFQKWKADKESDIAEVTESLERYETVQGKKIEEKKCIIAEIESGVDSLKEMSAEQKQKE